MRFNVMLYVQCLYCLNHSHICRGSEAHSLYLVQVMDPILPDIPEIIFSYIPHVYEFYLLVSFPSTG